MVQIHEGYMPFGEYRTYYWVAGDLDSGKAPLLLLHGGPGSTHNYFETFDDLAETGRAIVTYDQIGCGLSSMPDQPALWTAQTWLDELEEIRRHLGLTRVHLLGQSWGGMLAIAYLCDRSPQGVVSAILSSTLPSVRLWEQEARRLVRLLPEPHRLAIERALETGDFQDPAYQTAMDFYMERYCFGLDGMEPPACVARPKQTGTQSYAVAWGANEIVCTGTLRNHEYLDALCRITQPALVLSGIDDECTPVVAKSMYDRLPRGRWELFAHSRHMPFLTERDRYMQVLQDWLAETEAGATSPQ